VFVGLIIGTFTVTFVILYSEPSTLKLVKSFLSHIPRDQQSTSVYLAIIAAVITVFVGPRSAAHFKRRDHYYTPFTEWCASAYGTINEFAELCNDIQEAYCDTHATKTDAIKSFRTTTSDIGYTNPTYVITHIFDMHKEIERGYKVLGMIAKYDEHSADYLDSCFDKIDKLWHYLEHKYPILIMPLETSDERKEILDLLTVYEIENIAADILVAISKYSIPKNDKKTIQEELYTIMKFLKKRMPDTLF
jgi:hypothetical protein